MKSEYRLSIRNLAAAGGVAAMLLTTGIGGAQVLHQDISVTINGEPVQFQDIGPQQINGRTMVPVRGVLEKLGATISYNNATQTVTASTPTMDIQLKIGSRTAIVNANTVTLDVPAQSIQDHTFVPLRFLGEALGAELKWDSATRTVVITTKDPLTGDRAGDIGDRTRIRRDDRPIDRPGTRPGDTRDDRIGDRPGNRLDDRPGRRPGDRPIVRGAAPVIDSFTQVSGKWLREGDTLEVRLEGTPGGDATFRVPGLAEDIPMQETQPGRYVGTWRVPAGQSLQLKSAAVIGSLKIGDRSAPLIQAANTVAVDAIPPRARDMIPEDKTTVADRRPNISAALDDLGSGVDPRSVRLLLNGHDVTPDATVTRDFVTFRPSAPLEPGVQEVELRLADIAGNERAVRWTFMEQPRAEGGIRSVTDNFDRVLQPGDVLKLEMMGSPSGQATFTAGNIHDVPLREDRPGHYVTEYTIRRGDDMADKPVAFHLLTPDGQKYEQASRAAVRVATGKPLPPVILSPRANGAPDNPMIVRGKTAPNGRVQVRVDYRNKVLGLIALQGTAADTVVTADKNGNWESEPINLGGILGSRGIEYTITATAVNSINERSEPTVMRFKSN